MLIALGILIGAFTKIAIQEILEIITLAGQVPITGHQAQHQGQEAHLWVEVRQVEVLLWAEVGEEDPLGLEEEDDKYIHNIAYWNSIF